MLNDCDVKIGRGVVTEVNPKTGARWMTTPESIAKA